MQITEYEHSCLDIRVESSRLIIDPGKFTKKLTDFSNIDAVLITHTNNKPFAIKVSQLNI